MLRIGRRVLALIASGLLLAGAPVHGQEPGAVRAQGRRLDEALADLQGRGLKIIYSSQVVRPDMHVRAEPRVTSLRRILDEMLSPHGLIAKDGPGGTVLIVKNPRARLQKTPPQKAQAPPPGPSVAAAGDTVEAPRYEETIDVVDAEPEAAAAGPPPFAVRSLEVRVAPVQVVHQLLRRFVKTWVY